MILIKEYNLFFSKLSTFYGDNHVYSSLIPGIYIGNYTCTILNHLFFYHTFRFNYLVSSPSSTFFAKLDIDTSLLGGVIKGSVLIVDRSITPAHNKIVVAVLNGKFSLCKICINSNEQLLITDNLNDTPVVIDQNSYVWGVVTSIITKLQ